MPPREPPTTMTTTINKMKRIRTAREDEPAVIRETDERRGNLCGELLRCQGGLSALAKVRMLRQDARVVTTRIALGAVDAPILSRWRVCAGT